MFSYYFCWSFDLVDGLHDKHVMVECVNASVRAYKFHFVNDFVIKLINPFWVWCFDSMNDPETTTTTKQNSINTYHIFPAEYGIETPTGDLKHLSNLSISNLRTTNPNIATTSTTSNPSYTHRPTNDNNYCLYKYNEFNECNHLMHNNSKLNGKNHVVQKNTFFKSFTRSSSFCRIKVNPKKFRNISFKFRKSDKVCCTPDYTATTASATSSQVRGKSTSSSSSKSKLIQKQSQTEWNKSYSSLNSVCYSMNNTIEPEKNIRFCVCLSRPSPSA